jgi:NADH-quinone oxidoreductase subunit G
MDSSSGSEISEKIPGKVRIVVDGVSLVVPEGSNLIEAIKCGGTEVPHYCYHPDLSIAGNCRMCQVQVKGQPKLTIACNTIVQEGMEVATHKTSKEVESAQAATLEFILINHPLDCTVCDQAGHCKLQDYHYEYNRRSSRFVEEKEHKVKAVSLGPTVMLDGERCIMCTRCVRFCDEVPGTSELGLLNRGDRSVISINPRYPLNNPFSGTVVDLCPVGALTHKEWRFNTRIWFTSQVDTICPGCSTGCNVKVAVRDGQVVQVKARRNVEVNKEWLCDEGRYGFGRFLPEERLEGGLSSRGEFVSHSELIEKIKLVGSTVVLVSPDLTLEDYESLKIFLNETAKDAVVAIAYQERSLSDVERKLVSPDYACNYRGALVAGLIPDATNLESHYNQVLTQIEEGAFSSVLFIGDRSISDECCTDQLLRALSRATTVYMGSRATSPLIKNASYVLATRSILERSGIVINRHGRVQYLSAIIEPPAHTEPEWRIFAQWLSILKKGQKSFLAGLTSHSNDREATRALLTSLPQFKEVSLHVLKRHGVELSSVTLTS